VSAATATTAPATDVAVRTREVLLVAGEASGDMHGADLVAALRRQRPDVRVRGIGGAGLRAAGMETVVDAASIAAMGLVEVRERLGAIVQAYRQMRRLVVARPDLLILIDFPEFNLALAAVAKRHGVPVLYYIGPQVWAWRQRRVHKIARRVDRLAVVFPFEPALYAGTQVRPDFVGHPLLDRVRATRDRAATYARHDLDPGKRLVTLLPGSRTKELRFLMPPMADAARRLVARGDVQCAVAVADTLSADEVAATIPAGGLPARMVRGDTYELVAASDVVLVASGTATLETALLERPMVIVYRMAALTFALARRLVSVPYIGMPNLVVGAPVVPELIQDEATGARMATEAARFLDDADLHARTVAALAGVRAALGGGGAAERTAAIASEMLS
jgi:lipid-A-disaccharide synthase